MLVLTRLLQQAVLVGTESPVRLAVFALFPSAINLQVKFSDEDLQVITLATGEEYQFGYRGATVRVQLVSVIRGQVRLAFFAPKWVKIDREEKRRVA